MGSIQEIEEPTGVYPHLEILVRDYPRVFSSLRRVAGGLTGGTWGIGLVPF